MNARIVVLGAGPAGLAFAHRYGAGSVVLEKAAEVGGLSRSIEIGDGVFDIGGHSFHTPHAEVLELVRGLMAGAWHQQPRDARVWVGGELIPYPFQHHFERLADQDMVRACRGHAADPARVARSAHFEEWILNRFGAGVAHHFMLPYNRKLWARDLRGMACDWVGQRVATERVDPGTAARPERRPLQSDSHVAYPAEGGFGAIFEALARQCPRIELDQEVVRIDAQNRLVHTRAGQTWRWDRLVSTMPLPALLRCLGDCPADLLCRADELQAVSLKILMLLVRLRNRAVPQRIYIADPGIPPHKVAFNHTSSPALAGRPHHAIMCEVSYSADKPAPPDDDLLRATVGWLADGGYLAGPQDVAASRVVDVPLGYPVNTHAKPAIVAEIRGYLATRGIHSIGRFGAWDYANSDECMRQGLALADALRTT